MSIGRCVPAPNLVEMIGGVVRTAAVGAAARHGIADLVAQRPLAAGEIAKWTGTNPDAMHRLLRLLVSLGVLACTEDGRFAATEVSRQLTSDHPSSLRAYAQYFGSASNIQAYADLDGTLRDGGCAFDRVHGQTMWQWFDDHADEARTFAQQMRGFTALVAPLVARSPSFSSVTCLCDVSGGTGTLLSEILLIHPKLRAILFDRASVLAFADELLGRKGVLGRVQKAAGDFFEEVPAGADGYVLKDVLHNWDDARSTKILANIRRAAEPGARLFVVEVLLEQDEFDLQKAVYDVHMMVSCSGGRQRSRSELENLFGESSFRMDQVERITPFHSLVVGTAI